jgi:hypothetical protein
MPGVAGTKNETIDSNIVALNQAIGSNDLNKSIKLYNLLQGFVKDKSISLEKRRELYTKSIELYSRIKSMQNESVTFSKTESSNVSSNTVKSNMANANIQSTVQPTNVLSQINNEGGRHNHSKKIMIIGSIILCIIILGLIPVGIKDESLFQKTAKLFHGKGLVDVVDNTSFENEQILLHDNVSDNETFNSMNDEVDDGLLATANVTNKTESKMSDIGGNVSTHASGGSSGGGSSGGSDGGASSGDEGNDESTSTCSDSTQNGDETGVDCGGSCSVCECSVADTQNCSIVNGEGLQSRSCTAGHYSEWSNCVISSCNSGYSFCGNGCNVSYRSCSITNGAGNQSGYCSSNSWLWNTCNVVSCNLGYNISGNSCAPDQCSDGVQNGNETGIDCGGSCGACGDGIYCTENSDCSFGNRCSGGVCLLNVTGNTYFVATNGNDARTKTQAKNISTPWLTWTHAFEQLGPGDILYVRGGVYPAPSNTGNAVSADLNGNAGNPIRIFAYPADAATGNVPILDCENVTVYHGTYPNTYNIGIAISGSYVHVKGLTVRNVLQFDELIDDVMGWSLVLTNSLVENCVVHDIGGRGFWSVGSNNLTFLNDDAYNCFDTLGDYPGNQLAGNDGYGFFIEDTQSTTKHVYVKNCRAWGNGDDGFIQYSTAYVDFDGCWAYDNGALEGEGHGFKLGAAQLIQTDTYRMTVKNCIATNNRAHGFTTNDNGENPITMSHVYNNLAYHNGYYPPPSGGWPWGEAYGFIVYSTGASSQQELGRVYRNNIAYDDEGGALNDGFYHDVLYNHSNNNWDTSITVTAADFVSLNYSQLKQPRQADGSLPNITFGHLAAGSDLIDAGVNVGLPYNGTAPDMGAFER